MPHDPKSIGNSNSELNISESEQEIITKISNKVDMTTLIVIWQLILKTLDELAIVSSPILSLEMLIVRMVHLKQIPDYENILETFKRNNLNEQDNKTTVDINFQKKKVINEKNQIEKVSKDQIKNITQTKPILSSENIKNEKIKSFEDLIVLSSKKREVHLKYDLENNVNLIKFSEGKIDISFNENLDKNFVRNLSEKLFEWTGDRWVITLGKEVGQ